MFFVAFVYLAVNVAYFAVVSKTDMLGGGTIPAYEMFLRFNDPAKLTRISALFFRNLYGPATERVGVIFY
jgi:hypothetical protein